MHHVKSKFALAIGVVVVVGALQGCSGGSGNTSNITALQAFKDWNRIAVDASGVDHAGLLAGQPEQPGPCRSSRAMAIVHIAMFEALIAANGGYASYVGLPNHPEDLSQAAAVAKAARDTLANLFPAQVTSFDDALAATLALVEDGARETNGVNLGQQAASAIMALRFGDGSQAPEQLVNVDFICSDQPGFWRQDPISMHPLALGAMWPPVLPFVMNTADQFRAPVPPLLSDPAYTAAYNEVKSLGGDGIVTPTVRVPDQTVAGIYWAYDGTPSLCAPPRLYNQIASLIANLYALPTMEYARLMTVINVAQADVGLACWESKYFYQYWRPVTGVREADAGTGPSGLGDGNAATVGDVAWTPLGAPASNTTNPNFTPPFPAYPSGHAAFGGAIFQVLRRFVGSDTVPFTFVSDEFDGITLGNDGNPRPLLPRSFSSFSQAEEENGQSRIYLGIHWAFDKTGGISQGNLVGDWVYDNIYQPVP